MNDITGSDSNSARDEARDTPPAVTPRASAEATPGYEPAEQSDSTRQYTATAVPAAKKPFRRRRSTWIGAGAIALVLLGGAALGGWDDDEDRLSARQLDRVVETALGEFGEGSVTDVERSDDGGFELEVQLPDGREVDLLLDSALDRAIVVGGDDSAERSDGDSASRAPEGAITADESSRAGEAAVSAVGEGTVVDVDRSNDDGAAFEVEVRQDNGDEYQVLVDDMFRVLGTQLDASER